MLDILISSVGSSLLLAAIAWLGRAWLKERLTASIRLDTGKKLANVKSELDRANQKIRDLSATAVSADAEIESALLPHKIEGIQVIWRASLDWQEFSSSTSAIALMPDELVLESAGSSELMGICSNLLENLNDFESIKVHAEVERVRPFLSKGVWAVYSAYHSFNLARLTKVRFLSQSGVDIAAVLSAMNERALIAASAPDEILMAYDKNKFLGSEQYLSHLREQLLAEFEKSLCRKKAGQQSLKYAAQILEAAEELSQKTRQEVAQSASSLAESA